MKNKKTKSPTQTDTSVIPYKLTVKGSLGLLAYGDKGLRAWRQLKQSAKNTSQDEK